MAPRPSCDHAGQPAVGEVERRLREQPQLLQLARAVALVERLVHAEAGAVDEHLDVAPRVGDERDELACAPSLGEVGGQARGVAELGGELPEAIRAAGHERHVIPACARARARSARRSPARRR